MRAISLTAALGAAAIVGASSAQPGYIGCFRDDHFDRVLTATWSSLMMTPSVCAEHCASESSHNMYYATQYGNECWCAAEVDLRHGEGRCDYPCAGDAGRTCGGVYAFDLFELEGVGSSPSLLSAEIVDLGCFADRSTDRVLEDKISSTDMTVEACEDYCMAKGHPLFALQYGEECWCGGCELLVAGPGRYDRHGTASCAGFPCSGDATQTCGGIYAFSLYYRGTCAGQPTTVVTAAPATAAPVTLNACLNPSSSEDSCWPGASSL